LAKQSRTYFLTAYVEYLLDEGIRSEDYYLGDASRFLRFLLARATAADVEAFIDATAHSPAYAARLRKTLRKFFRFARERLDLPVGALADEPAGGASAPEPRLDGDTAHRP